MTDYREIKPENVTGIFFDYRKTHKVLFPGEKEPTEVSETEHIRMGVDDLRCWATLTVLSKVSWARLVETTRPDLFERDSKAAQRQTDQCLAALLIHGLADPARIERDGLDGGPYVQRMLAQIAGDREAEEEARKEEEAELQRQLRRIRAKKGEKVPAEAGLEVPND